MDTGTDMVVDTVMVEGTGMEVDTDTGEDTDMVEVMDIMGKLRIMVIMVGLDWNYSSILKSFLIRPWRSS